MASGAPGLDQQGQGVVPQAQQYSRAFDNIVQGPNDVVGLLAYALFKEAIREEMQQGGQANNAARNPTPATVIVYRGAAEQRIAEVIQNGISQATPDIQAAAVGTAVQGVETSLASKIDGLATRLEAHVTGRTGFWAAIGTNLIAWIVTLAITVIVLVLANRGSVEDIAVNSAGKFMNSSDHEKNQGNRM